MNIVALIPAYNPPIQLVSFVRSLAASAFFSNVIVVNDGSVGCDNIFEEIEGIGNVSVVKHAVNLGKGAALKSGLNYAYCKLGDQTGIVTVDADGQHLPEDTGKIADALREHPESLVLGVRIFGKDVPLRSKIGNSLTRYLFTALVGQKLTDTQSGLRGIPGKFIPELLKIESNGYEFELDMLLACRYTGRQIIEQEINTVYIGKNRSSHFHPIVDSMKIYFVLFRFTLVALFSALIDYTVFILVYSFNANLLASQISARSISLFFNYSAVKKTIFYSDLEHSNAFPKYLALVFFSGAVSYLLIRFLTAFTPLHVIAAKICAESIVFLANFAIQRDFIFTGRRNVR